jgi:hypothetical protein
MPIRPPLGIPNGSVRALLSIQIVAVVIYQLVTGHEIEPVWTELLMIVLAHYFTSRRFVHLAPDVMKRLEDEGHIEAERHPLFLPRNTIPVLLVAAFIGLAIYLYQSQHLDSDALSMLGFVFAYLLGVVARGILNWSSGDRRPRPAQLWEDIKALVVLSAMAFTAGGYLLGLEDHLPHVVRDVTLGMVLFYFGSR